MRIDQVLIREYTIPFCTTFQNSRASFHNRKGFFVTFQSGDLIGRGEAAPLPGFSSDTLDDAQRALAQFRELISLKEFSSEAMLASIVQSTTNSPAARFALETALLDLQSSSIGSPLFQYLSPCSGNQVSVNAFHQPGSSEPLPNGITTVKLKMGLHSFETELAYIRRWMASLVREVKLRLDVNGGWNLPQALQYFPQLEDLPVDYVEQPLPASNLQDLAELRRNTPLSIAVDESLTDIISARKIIAEEAADVFIIKPTICGGFESAGDIIRLARATGILPVIAGLIESNVGRMAQLHLAAAHDIVHPCGMLTGHLLDEPDQIIKYYQNGSFQLPAKPGLGLNHEIKS